MSRRKSAACINGLLKLRFSKAVYPALVKTHRFPGANNANKWYMGSCYQLRSLSHLSSSSPFRSSGSGFQQNSDSRVQNSEHALAKRKRSGDNFCKLSPSYGVAKISYDGEVDIVQLRTEEIVKLPAVNPRDMLYLNLLSHQEYKRRNTVHREMPAAISPREESIIFSFANIRAVVGREDVVLFDAHHPSIQEFANELAYKFAKEKSADGKGLPLELVFLEEVLEDAVEAFNGRLRLFNPIVDSLLAKADNEIYSETGVHLLVPLKDSLQSFEIHVKQSLECLKNLMNDDEAMLDLLLTEHAEAAKAGKKVEISRHEHVELLLGVYAQQLSITLQEVQYLLQRLQSKQEFVAIALAGYRNRMVNLNVQIAVFTLSIGIATTVAGFYGMNLTHGMEESPTAFTNVLLSTSFVSAAVSVGFMRFLSGKTVQARASERLDEIETLNGALSDLNALDFVIKDAITKGDFTLNKEEFREKLVKARHSGSATDKEVDLLFDILDVVGDGKLKGNDFSVLRLTGRAQERNRLNIRKKS